MSSDLTDYYSRRAIEYEKIFHRPDPVRQAEQTIVAEAMWTALAGRRVLEVACGTGYWTERLAGAAASVLATDMSLEMLQIARAKQIPNVTWREADAWSLEKITGEFDAGLANFWFSHLPRRRIPEFLGKFHARLMRPAAVFMADNIYLSGVGGDLVTRAGDEDTYKRRVLEDGSKHEVLKNYYNAAELEKIFKPFARNFRVQCGHCFWWISYESI